MALGPSTETTMREADRRAGGDGACASSKVHDYLMDRDANLAVQLMTKASKLSMVSYGAPGILVILVSVRPALISAWIR